MANTNNRFGVLVRERRRELGMTQANLAFAIGISSSHLARIETGKRKPSPKMLDRLMGELELPVSSITDVVLPESTYIAIKNQQEVDKELLGLRSEVKRALLKIAPIIEEIV
jgi:transcriptional regulator with XRE-family HTH domain